AAAAPRATAQHPRVVRALVLVGTPLPDLAVHVAQAPRMRRELLVAPYFRGPAQVRARRCGPERVFAVAIREPAVQLAAEVVRLLVALAGAARVFPLVLVRQREPAATQRRERRRRQRIQLLHKLLAVGPGNVLDREAVRV